MERAAERCSLEVAADMPMLDLDGVLFEQGVLTLLYNEAKYARVFCAWVIRSSREKEWVALQIIDEGDGIPPAELDMIFDKFYRAQKGDHVRPRQKSFRERYRS